MPMRTVTCVLLALAAGCSARPTARALPMTGPSHAVALLVGIDEYAQPGRGTVPVLAGAENDVRRAGEMLVDRFGFAADDVLVLTGEQATHAGIVRAFHEHLIQRAVAGTKVVFWYSGHGSRIVDLSGIESSKTGDFGAGAYDNSILAFDSRAEAADGSYDIADDELHSLLRALAAITDQVLVVTDCCHSSGAVRGDAEPRPGIRAADAGGRGLSRSALTGFWPATVAYLEDDEVDELGPFPYVHIAACADYQEAGEITLGGATHGTLSWFLIQAMDEVQSGDSWRALVERVRARVAGCGNRPDQIVTAAGDIDRLVFHGDAAAPLPGFRVDRADGALRISAGRVHGITDGAVFEIRSLRDGVRRGLALSTLRSASWSLAEWFEGGEAEFSADALRAIPRPSAMGRAPLCLVVDADLDAGAMAEVPWVVLGSAEVADYRLQRTEQGAVLRDMQGRRVRPVPLDPARMREALFREYTFRGLWESVVQPSALAIELTVETAAANARALGAERGIPLATVQPVASGAGAARVVAEPMSATVGGSLLTLRVRNRSDVDLRLTVLSLSEDRAVNIVWPPRNEWDRVLRAREAQAITVLVGPSIGWSEPRPMIDRYLAIATREPADFTAFTSDAPEWSATRGAPPAVPPFLRSLLAPAPTRGQDQPDADFGLACCDLHLSPPPAVDAAAVRR